MNMTCKDCIHCGICGKERQFTNIVVEDRCKTFADKSRYIELPCKVGDTVYIICDDIVGEQELISITYDGFFRLRTMCPCYSDCEIGDACMTESNVCESSYSQFEIGHSIFFTREEAEKALKEK